ncbi:hypothetical protein LO82_19665 [Vibrio vulnificus]|nr:hypothetical protein LO82_19665 [Vibrio vulnificus]
MFKLLKFEPFDTHSFIAFCIVKAALAVDGKNAHISVKQIEGIKGVFIRSFSQDFISEKYLFNMMADVREVK